MNRFFVGESELRGGQVVLVRQQAHQIRDVLRLRPGDGIVVLDNQGLEYQVTLTAIKHEQVVGEVVQKRPAGGEPKAQITLYQSLLTRDKFEFVLQKCTEVGVSCFVPVVTGRSIVRGGAPGRDKLERWQRIVIEAAEQSGRGRIPQIREPVEFEQVITDNQISNIKYRKCGATCSQTDATEFEYRLIASPSSDSRSLRDVIRPGRKTVALFIGPEGGFSEQELCSAREQGIVEISLGQRILRTETAAVVASALVLYELGEMEVGI